MTIEFVIPGEPVPKGRGRAFVVRGRAHVFTPPKTRAAEQTLAARAMAYRPKQPVAGAVRITAMFVLGIPASWSKKKQATPPPHTSRPDLDNLLKLLKDALNGVFWIDDRQITAIEAGKCYGAVPQTYIKIEAQDEANTIAAENTAARAQQKGAGAGEAYGRVASQTRGAVQGQQQAGRTTPNALRR